jgi:hypothetical protein
MNETYTMDSQRMDRVEKKLDTIVERLETLVRLEERHDGAVKRIDRQELRLDRHSDRLDRLEVAGTKTSVSSSMVERAVWAAGAAILSGATYFVS